MNKLEASNAIKNICKWLEENDKNEREKNPKLRERHHYKKYSWYINETSIVSDVRNWCSMLLESAEADDQGGCGLCQG